jgi:hypothetical protein
MAGPASLGDDPAMSSDVARLRILLRATRLDLANPCLAHGQRWIIERRRLRLERLLVEVGGPDA